MTCLTFCRDLARIAAASTCILSAICPAHAEPVTTCTIGKVCYCVDSGLSSAIDREVGVIESLIATQRSQGKAIGYLSVPLSTAEGSDSPLNAKVSAHVKERVEERLGVRSAWLLNPGAPTIALPPGAHGAEYMLMWTRVLEGSDGLGPDFDFVYFVGPNDFAHYLGLDGHSDLEAGATTTALPRRTRKSVRSIKSNSATITACAARYPLASGRTMNGTSCGPSTSGGGRPMRRPAPSSNSRFSSMARRWRRECSRHR